jgi:hypothetical protein
LDNIIHSIKNNEFESWESSFGIKYCISPVDNELPRPSKHMTSGVVRTMGHPTPITGSGVHISYSAGNISQKFTDLIKDARNQLPDNLRGIIVIKGFSIDLIEQKIQEIIKWPNYKKIIGIVALSQTQAFISKNSHHPDIPQEMLYRTTYKCS